MTGKRLVFHQTGAPSAVLELESNIGFASPAPGEVLVRVLAAPLNPADLNTIEGTYGVKLDLPATPGIEGCGEVIESASGDFSPGDKVIFLRRSATWASHAFVPADTLFKLPPEIDPLQAAMLKVNPATAWQMLHTFGKPGEGEWVVQNVGNSAVGRCVIQLAHRLGIKTISFVRRAELFDELTALGADHVVLDDDDGQAKARETMGGAHATLALNAVGGDSALRLMKLLREGGHHITYGAMGRKPVTIPNGLLIFRGIQIHGFWVTRWLDKAPPEEAHAVYGNLASLVAAGQLDQQIDTTFPLESFSEALARLDAPDRSGKVLFIP